MQPICPSGRSRNRPVTTARPISSSPLKEDGHLTVPFSKTDTAASASERMALLPFQSFCRVSADQHAEVGCRRSLARIVFCDPQALDRLQPFSVPVPPSCSCGSEESGIKSANDCKLVIPCIITVSDLNIAHRVQASRIQMPQRSPAP